MPRFPFSLALAAAALLGPGSSSTAGAQARLSNGGLDLHLFRPAVDSKGLIAVDGSEVLGAGHVSFGLVLDAGFGLVPFDGFGNDEGMPAEDARRTTRLVDQLFTGTLMGSYGIANVAAVGVQVPVVVGSGPNATVPGQWNEGGAPRGYEYQGLGDLVLHGKLRLLRTHRDPVGLAVIARIGIPTGDGSAFAGEAGAWLWPTLVLEWRPVRALRIAAEAGYRLSLGEGATLRVGGRTVPGAGNATAATFDPAAPGRDVTWGDVITLGAGASLRVVDAVDLLLETSATQIAGGIGAPHTFSAEALAGIKVFVERNSYLTVAAGLGITDGIQAPDLRGVLGFVFEPSIGDRDGDGIPDDIDQCPDEPEDFDGWQDEDGCPDPDNDRDGVLDVDDACPNVPCPDGVPDCVDGCPVGRDSDRDGDGIPDAIDQCPDDPEDFDGWQDEDGCPDPDNDGDGILDVDDLCPNDPEDFDGFEDEDGCPDPDNDGDGILDVDDACPNEPETYNGFEDEDGCPDRGSVIIEDNQIIILEKIYFETDSAVIQARSHPILDAVAATLTGNPQIRRIEIQGHADERGSDEYNIRLTRDRAAAVMEAVVQRGVARERVRSAGYGERCPVDPRHVAAAWERNRRVEFKIIATDAGPTGVELACPAGRALTPR